MLSETRPPFRCCRPGWRNAPLMLQCEIDRSAKAPYGRTGTIRSRAFVRRLKAAKGERTDVDLYCVRVCGVHCVVIVCVVMIHKYGKRRVDGGKQIRHLSYWFFRRLVRHKLPCVTRFVWCLLVFVMWDLSPSRK